MAEKNDDLDALYEGCLTIGTLTGLAVLFSPVYYVASGVVLRQLWIWFVSETFGVMSLTIPQAIGVAIVVGLLVHYGHLTYPGRKREKPSGKEVFIQIISQLVYLFVMLGIGWIVHQFV